RERQETGTPRLRSPSRSGAILVATLLLLAPCFTSTATASDTLPCESPAATIVARSGRVDLRSAGSKAWSRVEIGDVLCHGDEILTGSDGHVVWQTPDGAEHRLFYEKGAHVEFGEPEEDKSFIHRLRKGL